MGCGAAPRMKHRLEILCWPKSMRLCDLQQLPDTPSGSRKVSSLSESSLTPLVAEMGRQWDKGVEVLQEQSTGQAMKKQVTTRGQSLEVLGGDEKASRSQVRGQGVGIEETRTYQH